MSADGLEIRYAGFCIELLVEEAGSVFDEFEMGAV